MIIPDVNLLLYAYDSRSPHHAAAAAWWTRSLNGVEPVCIPRVVLFGFVRLATSPRVFVVPMTVPEAIACVREWLSVPHVTELNGGPDHVEKVFEILERTAAGHLVTDAQIAAMALEHRATLFTNDTDFRRFPRLRTVNPLHV